MKEKVQKIRVTLNREEVRELEISFPYYTRNNGLYCKFLSKDEGIWVYDYGFDRSVEWLNGVVPESWITFEPITKEEFNAKFNEVMDNLINLNNEKVI
jgi:hypothetical protein